MKEFKVFSLRPCDIEDCRKLKNFLNDGWLIQRVDGVAQESYPRLIYILERMK